MSPNLDWLVRDVRERFPAEGKDDLGDAIRSALHERTRETSSRAAELARRHGEVRHELFAIYLDVMTGYSQRGDSCEDLLDRALGLVARAAEHGLDPRDERLCYYNYALDLLEVVDLPGHARDILALVDDLDAAIPRDLPCRSCIVPSRGRARWALGDLDGAEAVFTDELTRALKPATRVYRLLNLAELAAERGDPARADDYHARASRTAEALDKPDRDVDVRLAGARVNLLLARGDLDAAVPAADALVARVEPWHLEGIEIDLAAAACLAREGRRAEAAARASRCAPRAEARGARRRHAEARLVAAESLLADGLADAAREHVDALGRVIPALRTRDLDARAEAVGAELSPPAAPV